jgi:glycerol-3-phosphate dehydrogenase
MEQDLLVIGGGINGVGVAADAAGRGLRVTLCEMSDLSSGTSSASSRLIHGGLRYLETYDFKLVRESLVERSILTRLAPHLIHLQPFVMPHCPQLRPYWMLRLGLFIYDHLSYDPGIPSCRGLNSQEIATLQLKSNYNKALEYYDCTEDDSRLVLHVALLAQQQGATIMPRSKIVAAHRMQNGWHVTLEQTKANGRLNTLHLHCKAIVNAAGPWAQKVANEILGIKTAHKIKLVKGSHLVVPRIFNHDKAFILQHTDGRVIFLLPYLRDFTLIGTTDILLNTIENPPIVSDAEIQYLCDVTNKFVQNTITPEQVLYKYAGIRPLFDDNHKDASKISRDYVIDTDDVAAPVFTIFGGKITTYRHLAEVLCNKLTKYFPNCGAAWTKDAYLPGGDFQDNDIDSFRHNLIKDHENLPPRVLMHYVNNYGTRALDIIADIQNTIDLGIHFGALLYQCEVDYLVKHEWARTAEDILWRRGKMGLWFNSSQVQALEQYLARGC